MQDYEEEARLPTQLWLDAQLAPLNAQGIFYYITHKGNPASGIVLLKLSNTRGLCSLLIQQRNFETGQLEWVHAMEGADIEETEADAYINRAIERDPDLWAIEIEDPARNNPFDK